ncbi:MAG: TerB family tellurite resistance protein [Myxococcales bacterium]|nr:TerB family tellurite resistance protein [Myxococcales bacterium]
MDANELTPDERRILFGLVGRVASADGTVAAGELHEIAELGEELGVDADAAIAEAREHYATLDDLLAAVATVEREAARQFIRTVLFDLASSDGDRGDEENELLSEVTRIFARN